MLEQDPVTQNYCLGPQLLLMGLQVRGWLDINKVALPVLQHLTKITEEDSYLTVAQGESGIFLDRVEGPYPVKVIETFGSKVPLHCGAARKVLLSFKDDDFIKNYLNQSLFKYTENTITDPDRLFREIEEIRKHGYALSCCEYLEHASGVAAPVRDFTGTVRASIGIIGLSDRFSEEKIPKLIESIKQAAGRLSKKLGYSPVDVADKKHTKEV
ncbi:MAG: IclR family transcriptional regulator [Firmicutes bacterium]|nr:IclR family transcriptional regulator [Bacillota bacterium]